MENRGSIDTTRPLIAIDYFYNSKYDVDKAKILYDFMCVPLNVMNINFRELQKQYLDGKKRNTQFRLDLN
jgi:hypothetical protein